MFRNFQTWNKILLHKKETIFLCIWFEIVFSPGTFLQLCTFTRVMYYDDGYRNTDRHYSNTVSGERNSVLLTTVLFLCWHKYVIRDKWINTILINKTSGQASRTELWGHKDVPASTTSAEKLVFKKETQPQTRRPKSCQLRGKCCWVSVCTALESQDRTFGNELLW